MPRIKQNCNLKERKEVYQNQDMEQQEIEEPNKNPEFGIAFVDNVGQFLNGSNIIYDNVTINVSEVSSTSPLPSIQSWLYPAPISTSDILACVSPINYVTEALQQITSAINHQELRDESGNTKCGNVNNSKDNAENINMYQVNGTVLDVIGEDDVMKEDKAQSDAYDVVEESQLIDSSKDRYDVTLTDREAPVSPFLQTVPVDLLRLLRSENITLQTDIEETPINDAIQKPRRKNYKVLTTVATQTVPESELFLDQTFSESPELPPLHEQNGKPRLESCRFLYQFLEAMLSDPKYDKLIKWRNKQERTFTLIDHNKVAHLWGLHKRKKSMTYDKFSRALRFYYSKNILRKENARFTYRFLTKEGSKLPF